MAFFSGTDVDTLISEGSDLNHFLSLIVCNAGQYVARITRKIKKKVKAEALITYTESAEYNTFENVNILLSNGEQRQDTKTEERAFSYIEYFDMQIHKTMVPEPFKELDERLSQIEKDKGISKYTRGYKFINPIVYPYNGSVFGTPKEEKVTKDSYQVPIGTQTSLNFKGHEEVEEEVDSASTSYEDEEIEFYPFEKVPFDIVRTLCIQLLTGSILSTSKSNINLEEWVKKMDTIFTNRFGDLNDSYNECRLKNWIETHVESIVCYSVNKDYEDKIADRYNLGPDYDYSDSDAFVHLYVCEMITYLDGLPKSTVKEMMLEELISLMPKEYEKLRDVI